jgi:hypothetical protein
MSSPACRVNYFLEEDIVRDMTEQKPGLLRRIIDWATDILVFWR